jgi:transposase
MSRLDQEKDPVVLHKAIELLQDHNRALTAKIAELLKALAEAKGSSTFQQLRLAALEKQLAKLTKQVFGSTSDTRPGEPAGASAEGDDKGKDDEKKKERSGHGPTKQPELPCVVVEHELDEPDKVCPNCGGGLDEMAGQYEEHDEIDVLPLRFVRKRHKRKKYVCRCGSCIETALGPDKLCVGGRYSVNFAIYVALSKYCDHLPLERQVKRMAREGLVVTSQTLWDQIEQLTWVVEPVMSRLRSHILAHSVVGADETRWELLEKTPGQGKSWYVWVLRVETAVYFAIRGSRSAMTAEALIGTFTGVLMCDGYKAYASLSLKHPRVVLAHCWAHVRREFVDVEKTSPVLCGEVLDLIAKLYLVERDCPKGPEGDEARGKLRNTASRGIVDEILGWFYRALPKCLPESGLHKAIGYMVHRMPGLLLFLDDPRIPLDNNGTERVIRGPVVGRKNHYGSHSLRGTEVAATLYSLVESAKLNGLDPRLYLRIAVRAGMRHETVPLPHEVKAMLAEGKLHRADYDDHTEGIVNAALTAASSVARAGPAPEDPDRCHIAVTGEAVAPSMG